MCLCDNDRHANCFNFDFQNKSDCQGRTACENNGQCVQDLSLCPRKCQFTTEGLSLSFDVILAYQIRQHTPINRQRSTVKVSITITTLMLFISLISGKLSTMTFQSKKFREVGCGIYLFISINTITFFDHYS
jgi:hypothetical protein